jgi:hypothetical protein
MFQIIGMDPSPFVPLYGLSDEALAQHGVRRERVTAFPGAPDRVSLDDVEAGGTVLLLNHLHQPATTPYRSQHAIYIREGAERAHHPAPGEVPPMMRRRVLSVRAFDAAGWMLDADLVDGADLAATTALIDRLLAPPEAAELHVHFAKRGCFAARVVPAPAE